MWPCSSHAGNGGTSGPLLTVPLIRSSRGPTAYGPDCEDSPYFRCRNMDELEAMRLFRGVWVRFSARDRPAAASGFGSSDFHMVAELPQL